MQRLFVKFALKATLLYCIVLFLYVMLWHGVFSGLIPLSLSSASSSNIYSSTSSGTEQTVNFQFSADVKIYRYGFLPVYWSRIGNVMPYHQICFSLLTFELAVALTLKYKQLKPLSKQKLLKLEPSIPIEKGAEMRRNPSSKRGSRIVISLWAVIGFLWFITYQLLSLLPPEVTPSLVGWIETLNLFMWIIMFASIGVIVLPYLKTIYYKIWEGGERHE